MTSPVRPPEWTRQAACVSADPALFFPRPNGLATKARAVCRPCPARVRCLEYVLDHPQWGVWGGFTESDRQRWLGREHRDGASAADIIAADDAEFYARTERLARSAERRAEKKRTRERERSAAARDALTSQEEAA